MVKKYRVALAEEEQQELKGLVGRGRAAAYRQTHARILLLCDENQANGSMKDEEIARALKVGTATVERVRRRCVEESLERALGRKLDFTHFKRHKRGNLQYDGTEWRGVSVHRSWRSIVKNPPTPTTSGYAQR